MKYYRYKKALCSVLSAAFISAVPVLAKADEADDIIGFMLNANGLLCAEIVDFSALKQKNIYEVTCVKYKGGKAQATYILDMNTGNAWED